MKKSLFIPAMMLLALGLGSCAKEGGVDRGDINGAIRIAADKITATSACITGECAQENVVGCYYVKPFETSEASLVDMDAIDKKAYILEHGVEVALPLKDSATVQLLAGTSYTVAVIGYDKDKVFRTAPYFTTFKTGEANVTTAASQANPSVFDFTWSIEKNEFASYVKYVTSTDKAVTSLDSESLKELILKGGDAVKTTKSDIPEAHEISAVKTDFVVAALAFDDLDRPGGMSTSLVTTETVVKVNTDAGSFTLSKADKDIDIFTGTVSMPATGSFTVNVSGKDYGFISYSGAGGIGTVNNMFSALPFYNLTADMNYKFSVDKALGRMAPVGDGGNKFWINMKEAAKVKFRIDLTAEDGTPRYYFEKITDESNIVFYEAFDLSVWGGHYQAPVKGTSPTGGSIETYDGTEAGKASGASTTGMGIDNFCYPASIELDGSEVTISDALMRNWGLQDWTFKKGYLSAGHIRVAASSSNAYSYVITPKFTKLTAPTNVTLEMEAWSFAATIKDVWFEVLGAGKFTKAVVTNTAGYSANFSVDESTLTDTKFIPDGTMLPKHANADVNKTVAKIVLSIEGATADTQIWVGTGDAPISSIKDSRICIDYFKVTK